VNGIAPRSQPLSDKDWILTDGLNWLVKATGRAEKGLRSQIGLWRKTLKDDSEELRSVFEAAQDADYADPIGSITKAVAVRANPTVPFQLVRLAQTLQAVQGKPGMAGTLGRQVSR
jgi:hypothetical protein